ncbi:MAG TPA: hypothetical protein VLA68_00875 [Nitrososphaera sp.]|nr:hypothetical protein [Nitrososphaera sp.]
MSESDSRMPDKVDFKMLDYSVAGTDTVTFKLEDGTVVKVKVGIERVGVATNYRNPDGSLHYAVNTSVKLYVIPYDKRFTLSRSQVKGTSPGQPPDRRGSQSHIT